MTNYAQSVLKIGLLTAGLFLGMPTTDSSAQTVSVPAPEMVLIESGSFVMGSPDSEPQGKVDEVRHQITLNSPFWLSATEVTQGQWRSVMGTDPGYFPECTDCPIESVSWFDAIKFCIALSLRQDLTPAYRLNGTTVQWLPDTNGYRLPTEAEWEYACRTGTATAFSNGPCLPDNLANYNSYQPLTGCPEGMHRGEPIAVASFPPNAWGLFDMHGNINEWCWDWYGAYDATATAADPRGPQQGTRKVYRGGCFANFGAKCRSANRERLEPARAMDMVGFRVARSAGAGKNGP